MKKYILAFLFFVGLAIQQTQIQSAEIPPQSKDMLVIAFKKALSFIKRHPIASTLATPPAVLFSIWIAIFFLGLSINVFMDMSPHIKALVNKIKAKGSHATHWILRRRTDEEEYFSTELI